MPHGSQEYFRERARCARRLSLTCASVSLVLLAVLTAGALPVVRRTLAERVFRGPLGPQRFGFEGPEQYVRRIFLETSGPPGPRPGRPTMILRSAFTVKGGSSNTELSNDPHAPPETRRPGIGPGESAEDLVARARVIYGGGALVMQSEDLVIERLVKPEYPQDARDRNIEGGVALVALVDTAGAVARVDLMSSTGEKQLEEAAVAAVKQCRFRPYRVRGRPIEVHAVFRFAFRIYD